MKTRNGFVSNSSSSSFIVAVAKVVDKAKTRKWLKGFKIEKYNCNIVTVKDIIDEKVGGVSKVGDNVIVSSFMTDARLNVGDMDDKDKILFVNIINNEGDTGIFSGYSLDTDDYIDINYDIDVDDLPYNQPALYEGLGENNGLSNVDKRYGAGRDG